MSAQDTITGDQQTRAGALRLAHARTTGQFVGCARDILDRANHVALDTDRLTALEERIQTAEPVSWDWLLSDPDGDIQETALDFALFAAPNGGYFHADAAGEVVQWAEDGSGARALESWFKTLRATSKLPGRDITDPNHARDALASDVAGLPYAEARLEIAAEFADPGRRAALEALIDGTRSHTGQHVFRLDHADRLARIFPTGFGDDPFRKKAALFFLFLHGHLHHRGHPAVFDLPVPSDYQLPRILEYLGAIRISDAFRRELRHGTRLLDVTSAPVVEYRAAAIVCADLLRQATGQPTSVIDSALFIPFRKDPDFLKNSLPPMRCDTLWF